MLYRKAVYNKYIQRTYTSAQPQTKLAEETRQEVKFNNFQYLQDSTKSNITCLFLIDRQFVQFRFRNKLNFVEKVYCVISNSFSNRIYFQVIVNDFIPAIPGGLADTSQNFVLRNLNFWYVGICHRTPYQSTVQKYVVKYHII